MSTDLPFQKKELEVKVVNPNNLPCVDYHKLSILQGSLKTLSETNREKLCKSILDNGFFIPAFIWRSGEDIYILDATQRYHALRALEEGVELDIKGEGHKELIIRKIPPIPYIEIEAKDKKDAAKKLLQITSRYGEINTETTFFTDFDIDLDYLNEISIPELYLAFEDLNSKTIEEDEMPEVPEEAITKVGDLWILNNHRVLCGDCTKAEDVERVMTDKKAEILFTSPPYFDLREYENNSNLEVSHIIEFIEKFHPYTDYQIVNLGLKRKDNEIIEYWQEYIQKAKKVGYKFLSWNVWDRLEVCGIVNQTAMFEIDHEWIFVFGNSFKTLNRLIEHSENTKDRYKYGASTRRLKDGTLKDIELSKTHKKKQLGTIQRIGLLKARTGDNMHPAMFPIELPAEYVKAMTQEKDIVCDPFLGSGTTLIASDQLNRICYGIEIEPRYVDVILERYANLTGNDPIREDGKKWSEVKSI